MNGNAFSFQARGYGAGEMTWKVPGTGRYEIVAEDGDRSVDIFAEADNSGVLSFTLRTGRYATARVSVRHLPGS